MAQLLLATNLSPSSDRAVDRAKLITSLPDFELCVLYVLPKDRSRPQKHVLREIDRAKSRLQTEFQAAFDNAGQKTELVAVHGDPQSEIVTCAMRSKALLVVMGDTREFSMSDLFRGTLADRVISEADCAVLIVHTRPQSHYQKVLLPFNDTPACYAAFEMALKLAPDAQFTVLHAETDKNTDVAELHDKKKRFENLLGATIKKLSGSKSLVSTGLQVIIERGDPTEVILRKAEQLKPDLTAFGRSNKSGLRSLVLGSTAQVIVEHLDCDLLVAAAVQPEPSE